MTVTLSVQCPNEDCEAEIEVEADVQPGEMYGADADGSRGIWIGPSVLTPDAPESCPECKIEYGPALYAELQKRVKIAAEEA